MFCQNCGTTMQDGAALCASCGTPVSRPRSSEVGVKVRAASRDAADAFKVFAVNPVGGLPAAYESLGETRAIAVGLVFAAIFDICILLGTYIILPAWSRPAGITSLFKIIIFGAVPFIVLFGAVSLTRRIFGGEGSIGGDSFIAGASLLPFGFIALLGGVLGMGNIEVIAVLAVFALCYTILMLYTGCTRISKISEARSALAVPFMVIISGWLAKILYSAMLF